jgi:hypothetical protein
MSGPTTFVMSGLDRAAPATAVAATAGMIAALTA